MVLIPAGEILMGSENHEKRVSLNAFHMDKYEVTQEKFEIVTGGNPSFFKGKNLPVESVTWFEAGGYCKKVGKRLPTEAEWEFAAQAGTKTRYYWGKILGKNKANCNGCDSPWENKGTAPVGSFPPNPWGLFDMSGNVWEWVANDQLSGKFRVLRGGSWHDWSLYIRISLLALPPSYRINSLGFRCAR